MVKAGPDEKVYPVVKIAMVVNALAAEGVALKDALAGVAISKEALSSPATRVSLNEVVRCYGNAARLSRDPRFAYHVGLKFHVSTYGMYGFAILSSANFRQTMQFAVRYHQLATPVAEISFKEERQRGVWTIAPIAHPRIDAVLYRFIVEMQFGIHVSLHRDIMGPAFRPRELTVTYGPPVDAQHYRQAFESDVRFDRPDNRLMFDARLLDGAPDLGAEITYAELVKLCDGLMEEMQLHAGLAGKVRKILLVNSARPAGVKVVAQRLHMTARTLRRKLRAEKTSFRKVTDELKMSMAIKYLRDTELTVDEIAHLLGYGDTANFRRAFRRWTKRGPLEFRGLSRRVGRAAA